MDIQRVDHYSIRTEELERSRDFYAQVIGLREGPRPPFDFPGYWLYAGEHAIVHLMGYNPQRRGCRSHNVPFRERTVPQSNLSQVFLQDPDGVAIEINYRT